MTRSGDNTHSEDRASRKDFIRSMVEADLASGKHSGRVVTRFPPEPNGYLHVGHAKSICLNFGLAEEYPGAVCHLRFDDTNPTTENPEFVESIQYDLRWLGFDWQDHLFFASDYFERFYVYAEELVAAGKAYVDSLSEEQIREYRGSVTEPGKNSPYRDRSVEENLDLLRRMRAGEFVDGEHVLRAKIDMAAANMKMRDPLLYRIRHAHHYRTGDSWCIYPMYDFAHCVSDAIERVTHSLCTLEFENNRDIYDWVLENIDIERPAPEQTEFARLAISYTVLSKRKLLELVEKKIVSGWDDPRMPTLSGMRRRGYTREAIRNLCDAVGVAKANSTVDVAQLEHAIRDDLNYRAPRVLAVLDPVRLVIENYPEDQIEELEAPFFPHDIGKEGSRTIPFTRELLIERDDFAEDPPPKFHRLAPGREVRLRYGYFVTCTDVVKDPDSGEVTEVRCTYDPSTRGGNASDGRKVKGTIHWVSATESVPAEVRLYDRLFSDEHPDRGKGGPDFKEFLNPDSLQLLANVRVEPSLEQADGHYQFERLGYFCADPVDSKPGRLVFNRVVTLRDSWSQAVAPQPAVSKTKGKRRSKKPPAPAVKRELSEEVLRLAEGLRTQHGLAKRESELLAERADLAALFERAVSNGGNADAIAKFVLNELAGELKSRSLEEPPFDGAALGDLVTLSVDGAISSSAAKQVLAVMFDDGGSPREIVTRLGLEQIQGDEQLRPLVEQVLAGHPKEVAAFRDGRESLLGFFVGQVMKASRGKADPRKVNQLLHELLASS